MRRALVLAAVLAAVAAGIVFVSGGDGDNEDRARPPCGDSPGKLEVAIQDDATLLHRHYFSREDALRRIRELGATWVRTNLIWNTVVPQPDSALPPAEITYDFAKYDSFLAAAERAGLCVEMTMMGPAPGWATGDGKNGVFRPDARRFGELAAAAAEHFRGRVSRYSIWNEPNYVQWIAPQEEAPAIYRSLFEAAQPAIDEADPDVPVLIGETAGFEERGDVTPVLDFLRALACEGCAPLEADGYAHHPYDFEHPPEYVNPDEDIATLATLDRLTSELDRLTREGAFSAPEGGLPLYLTEFGYLLASRRAIEPELAADYLPRAFELASSNPRVRQMLQYLLVQPPPDYPGGDFDTALLTTDGTPRPAWETLRAWVDGARAEGRLAEPARP